MFKLKGAALEGSGPGLIRIVGSFTTKSDGTPTKIRPAKGGLTITRKAAGVYVVNYAQSGLSLVYADAKLGATTAKVSTTNTVSLITTVPGTVNLAGDFMSSNGTQYSTDTTQSNFLLLCYAAASDPTSLTLTEVYGLGNTGGVANYRIMFEAVFATSTENQ